MPVLHHSSATEPVTTAPTRVLPQITWSVLPIGNRPVFLFAWALLLLALAALYSTWRRHAKAQASKRPNGCLDAPQYPHRDGKQGSDLARLRTDAMNKGRLEELYEFQFECYGKTFEENVQGKRLINTVDPANIHAITTVASEDYYEDPSGVEAQVPFLGSSILSDAPVWDQSRSLENVLLGGAEISDIDHLASFTDRFLETIPADGSTIDVQSLLHRLFLDVGVFLPARDTTSISIGNALSQLARNTKVWAKLRQISLALANEHLTFEILNSLVEFRHVVLETLRLSGPAARISRVAARDTTLPTGGGPDRNSPIFVPKGTTVVMGTWGVHHDRNIWGDDAQNFKPDRWIGRKPQGGLVPFLGGLRACPAQQQVLTHAVYILVRLTQRFESIEIRDLLDVDSEKGAMAYESRNGVKVAFR